MKILMMTRPNFFKLSGGDRVQLEKTSSALKHRGHKVTVSNKFVNNLESFDVIHLFNMQITPHTFMIYLLHAHSQGKPVALSTIYWNPHQWHSFSASQPSRRTRRSFLSYRFSGVPIWRVLQYFVLSSDVRSWFWRFLARPMSGASSLFIKRFLLKNADIVLPNGQAELEGLVSDFTAPKLALVVPNGADDDFMEAKADSFINKYQLSDFVLSVGRVETRKNLVALAKACKKLELPLVLIGNDKLEPDYVSQVRKAAGEKFVIVPELPYEQLGSAYKAAKVHALVSWFETPGLSNLEAAVAGCNIVSTNVGTANEYFGDMAWYASPNDQHSIEHALKAAFLAPKTKALARHILHRFSWNQVAEITEKAYKKIGKVYENRN